jgi:beta-galactosidase
MLYIGVDDINAKNDPGTWGHKRLIPEWKKLKGDSVKIKCFTNCDEAELFVNNVSLGRKKMTESIDAILSWDTKYEDGKLEAKGYRNNQLIIDTVLVSAGNSEILQASVFEDSLINKKETHVEQIEIVLKDKNKNIVFGADNEVMVKVSDGAVLLGLENGSLNNVNGYHSNRMKLQNGRLVAYIQVKANNKKSKIEISAQGIDPVVLYL